jgi:hypothetical protein
MSDIQEMLNAPIPRECISQKQGLSYISHRYIKEHLNTVFGWDGWSYEVIDKTIFEEKLSCFAHVRLTVMGPTGPVTRDGMALGFPAGQDTAQAFDFGIAESVTDALKRAAVSLGSSMGLELYPMTKGATPPQPGPPPRQSGSRPDHPSYERAMKSVEASQAPESYKLEDLVPEPPAKSMSSKPLIAEKSLIERFEGSIAGASSLSGLKMVGLTINDSGLTNAAKDGLHDIYANKKRELEAI